MQSVTHREQTLPQRLFSFASRRRRPRRQMHERPKCVSKASGQSLVYMVLWALRFHIFHTHVIRRHLSGLRGISGISISNSYELAISSWISVVFSGRAGSARPPNGTESQCKQAKQSVTASSQEERRKGGAIGAGRCASTKMKVTRWGEMPFTIISYQSDHLIGDK